MRTIARRRQVVIAAAVCVLVGIGLVAFWPGEKEAEYNGKKLSEWTDIYMAGIGPKTYWEHAEAVKAIQTIGTNALPILLKRAQQVQRVPVWEWRVAEHARRFGVLWPERFVIEQGNRAPRAWAILRILGHQANWAIPEVSQIALKSPSPYAVTCALGFLDERGPDGVPALLEVITNGKGDRRVQAINFIQYVPSFGTNASAVVEVLLNCLQDANEDVAGCAALSLGTLGLEARKVVPALTGRLRDSRRNVRYCASHALGNLANHPAALPDLRDAVPELVLAQQDSYTFVRVWATNALVKIAPEVLTSGAKEF